MAKTPQGNRAEVFVLLLALHRYSGWLSSLRSSRLLSARSAGRELQRIADLKNHFPTVEKRIDALLGLHLELIGWLASDKQGLSPSADFLLLVTRQGETVAELSAVCQGLTRRA